MKKLSKLICLGLGLMLMAGCGVHQTAAYTDTKTKCIGSELDGSYTLRVAGRARNAADAYEQAAKQAVYDMMFTYIDVQSGYHEKQIKPLLMEVNAVSKYESYTAKFLKDGGDYLKYVSRTEKRSLSSQYMKTNTQTVCITTVCVFREDLKQRLIADGIIKE